jgi:hypothetical protein
MSDSAESVHRIRLVGPWEWTDWPVADSADWKKIRLPDDWSSFQESTASAIFRRRFHCPTGIEPGDRVYVVIDTEVLRGTIRLNGAGLEKSARPSRIDLSFEITDRLIDHNTLEIALTELSAIPQCGLGRPVVLEIVSRVESRPAE